jgi:hypothetical protein
MRLILTLLAITTMGLQAQTPAKTKLIPGKVIVPFDAMRRIWGELISLDIATRTGSFRKEGDDSVISFTVMPYAELLHHAAFGDLQDFRMGERALFRLHEDDKGQWRMLTYIQDEMNMMNGHGEYFVVESIDAAAGKLTTTWAKGDMTFIREKNVVIETDAQTRYWKAGAVSAFRHIKVGDKIRTKTHGLGKGVRRVAWELFLDDESLKKFQAEQQALHAERIRKEGAPGYLDSISSESLGLTLFQDGEALLTSLKPGAKVRLASAGLDRKPTSEAVPAELLTLQRKGKTFLATVKPVAEMKGLQTTALMRMWIE